MDMLYCPSCLENMPSTEARLKKNRFVCEIFKKICFWYLISYNSSIFSFKVFFWRNCFCHRCGNCFDCPSCGQSLSTRASTIQSPDPEQPNRSIQRKLYYLACTGCRWTSRDVNIQDQTVGRVFNQNLFFLSHLSVLW